MRTMQDEEYWTIRDFCGHIQAGKSTIWEGVRQGLFPRPVKISGLARWKRSEIEACLEAMAAKRTPE